ncbi:MAG: hypothetical protein KBS73_04390 [Bacteroidales bacterium]|nr:hypothetical protein [Candidatus Cacconaster equifaecalis]
MRKISYIFISLALLFCFEGLLAQDCTDSVLFNAGKLKPAGEGANSKYEYAISGAVNLATTPGKEALRGKVKSQLEQAIEAASDKDVRQFLESQLYFMGVPAEPAAGPSEKELLASAKKLARSRNSNERCRSIWLYSDVYGKENATRVLAAMNDKDKAYRMTALHSYEKYADDQFYAALTALFPKLDTDAKADILYFLGEQVADSQIEAIIGEFDGANAADAMAAAAKIGGEKALAALVSHLGGTNDCDAYLALSSFNGDVRGAVEDALKTESAAAKPSLLKLAGERHCTSSFVDVVEALHSQNEATALAAANALKGVSIPEDAVHVANLLQSLKDENLIAPVSDALVGCYAGTDGKSASTRILSFVKDVPESVKERFYPVLASTNSDLAADYLLTAFKSGHSDAALKALSTIDNFKAAPALLEAASKDDSHLVRYVELISRFVKDDSAKAGEYATALKSAVSAKVKSRIIGAMTSVPTIETVNRLETLLDDPEVAYNAANALKSVVKEVAGELPYAKIKECFDKVVKVYQGTGNADDLYAIDEMKTFLSGLKK